MQRGIAQGSVCRQGLDGRQRLCSLRTAATIERHEDVGGDLAGAGANARRWIAEWHGVVDARPQHIKGTAVAAILQRDTNRATEPIRAVAAGTQLLISGLARQHHCSRRNELQAVGTYEAQLCAVELAADPQRWDRQLLRLQVVGGAWGQTGRSGSGRGDSEGHRSLALQHQAEIEGAIALHVNAGNRQDWVREVRCGIGAGGCISRQHENQHTE